MKRETVLYKTVLSKIKSNIILLLSNIWQLSHVHFSWKKRLAYFKLPEKQFA